MKAILNKLFEHKSLSRQEAHDTLVRLASGEYNHAQMAAFLTVFLMRSLRIEELEGFRDAMLELCVQVDFSDFDPIDIVGTGGDGKDTFNISTLSAVVVAAAGYKVAKHGNKSVSSVCGSSNVLEHLGYRFTNEVELLRRQLDEHGICFLHAPLFHPAMKNVVPVRQDLGVRTFFNILGPLSNPCFPKKQMLGVYSKELQRIYSYLYQNTDVRFVILYSLDGYDEISLTGPVKIISNEGEDLWRPEQMGFGTYQQADLYGGNSVAEAARIFVEVLEGKGTPAQQEVVIANAGVAIHCADGQLSLADSFAKARETLVSGKARETLKKMTA
ncbi:MAG: anthranilate phosphoribosyltransferase [Cytophagales bacterium]|nr:anthranilate phosphoribosyltransferase [Cytophagales bacterium]